jgi:hypothetical protein
MYGLPAIDTDGAPFLTSLPMLGPYLLSHIPNGALASLSMDYH